MARFSKNTSEKETTTVVQSVVPASVAAAIAADVAADMADSGRASESAVICRILVRHYAARRRSRQPVQPSLR